MTSAFAYSITAIPFDTEYRPAPSTRATTNFANLARGAAREENLRNVIAMIDNRFNALAHWDNPAGDRYHVSLDIITAALCPQGAGDTALPLIELLQPQIHDRKSGKTLDGITGNSLSSYLRDYDFSVVLPAHQAQGGALPADFGDLHGALFRDFCASEVYRARFAKAPVICLSVSSSRVYTRSANHHPVLGVEYLQDAYSPTDRYFAKMGLQVRYFMPVGSVAPLAFYFSGDLLADYTPLELIGTIATMESFQRIYRPEIYNANAPAGQIYRPSLSHGDYAPTRITYDREERSRLATQQGAFTATHVVAPYGETLAAWLAARAA